MPPCPNLSLLPHPVPPCPARSGQGAVAGAEGCADRALLWTGRQVADDVIWCVCVCVVVVVVGRGGEGGHLLRHCADGVLLWTGRRVADDVISHTIEEFWQLIGYFGNVGHGRR